MRTSSLWVAASLLAASACGGQGEQAQQGADGDYTAVETPATATPGSPAYGSRGTASTDHPVKPETMQLMALNNSGVQGTAVVTHMGDTTQVELRLTGGGANATHQAHVHSGSCEAQGSVAAPLSPVQTDASGSGVSTTSVTLPWQTLADGKHYIQAHEAGGMKPVTCGNIPNWYGH